MFRARLICVLASIATFAAAPSAAQTRSRTLSLPLRALGVSANTARASSELLTGYLEDLGLEVVAGDSADGCADPACAVARARERGASRVVYGSLTELRGKVIARVEVSHVDQAEPVFRDQLTANSEDELDGVMRRFAEGVVSGRRHLERPTVYSITEFDTQTPARRRSGSGLGVRAGFLIPTGHSYAGSGRLASVRAVQRFEVEDFQIEVTPLLGLSWSEEVRDWMLFDVSAARLFGRRDLGTYLGGSLGMHDVILQGERSLIFVNPGFPPQTRVVGWSQNLTAPTIDLFAGLIALRTTDLTMVAELRFHYMFARFNEVGGKGANGVVLSFGSSW